MSIAHIIGKEYDASGHLVSVDRHIGAKGDSLSYLVILKPYGLQMVGVYTNNKIAPPGIDISEIVRPSVKDRPKRGKNFTYVGSRWFYESETRKKQRASVKITIE